MKLRGSSAPGRRRPHGSNLPILLLVAIATVLGACGQSTTTDPPRSSGQSVATDGTAPSGTAETSPGEPTTDPADSAEPDTPEPATEPPSNPPAGSPGSAAACSGSDENRDFFASMAAAVDWTVYCPVLPDGWFVDDGQYRLAGGGWMRISYKGPGGARIVLQQGAFCSESGGCVPAGRDISEAAFGDRVGVVVAGDDGSWSTIVHRGAALSWLLVVTGLDEAGARTIAADLLAIAG